jgi:hypothetical protein
MPPGAFAFPIPLAGVPIPLGPASDYRAIICSHHALHPITWELHRVESTSMMTQRIAFGALPAIASILFACTTLSPQLPAEIPTSTTIATSPPGGQVTALPSPTPPLDAEFQDVTLIPGRLAGDWSVIGVVTNRSEASVGGVDLKVSLYDSSDALLAVQTVRPALTNLAAGGQSPFAARFPGAGAADHTRVEAIAYLPSVQSWTPIEIEQLETQPAGDGRMAAYGIAVNRGLQTVEIVELVLMATSPNGEPIAISDEAAGLSVLNPGASAPFAAILSTSDTPILLQAFSNAQPLAGETEQELSLAGPIMIQHDRDGSPLVVGTLHNDGLDWMTADVVVDLRRGDEIVGVSELELPWPLAPGESQPFLTSEFPGLIQRLQSQGIDPGSLVATAQIDPAGSHISTSPPITLEAEITAQEVIEGSLFLKGSLTNGRSEKVDRPSAAVVLRSTQGEVISAGFVVAGTQLGAGQSLPFILTLRLPADADVAMAEFDLRAAGLPAE